MIKRQPSSLIKPWYLSIFNNIDSIQDIESRLGIYKNPIVILNTIIRYISLKHETYQLLIAKFFSEHVQELRKAW